MAYKELQLTKEAAKALNEHWNDGVMGKGKKKPAAPAKKPAAKKPAPKKGSGK